MANLDRVTQQDGGGGTTIDPKSNELRKSGLYQGGSMFSKAFQKYVNKNDPGIKRGEYTLDQANHMVSMELGDPDALLRQMYDDQFTVFNDYLEPMIGQLEEEANSTRLVDSAREEAAKLDERSAAITAREAGRAGTNLTPAQRQAVERSRMRSTRIGEATMVNRARSTQQRLNEGARQDLMTTAISLQSGSTDALTTVSANKAQRDAAYEQASSQYMSNVMGTVGAVAGSFFGPMGTAAGGAIGSYIGGQM